MVKWNAFEKWTKERLNKKYGNVLFKVYDRKNYGIQIIITKLN